MTEQNRQNEITLRFEASRQRLRLLALRILGNLTDADDAVQEAWIRLSRTSIEGIENLEGWLTTVTSRICLDMLRGRRVQNETEFDEEPVSGGFSKLDPENEAVLADAVGSALLAVLQNLSPGERVSFVLHDLFDVGFGEVSSILGRSEAAVRQLASRARRRLREAPVTDAAFEAKSRVVKAFLGASREGNFGALLALLSPDAVWRADEAGVRLGVERELVGASAIAERMLGGAKFARYALLDGEPGFVGVVNGVPRAVTTFVVEDGKIVRIAFTAEPAFVAGVDIVLIDRGPATPLHGLRP